VKSLLLRSGLEWAGISTDPQGHPVPLGLRMVLGDRLLRTALGDNTNISRRWRGHIRDAERSLFAFHLEQAESGSFNNS
jgi:hypothetical protein